MYKIIRAKPYYIVVLASNENSIQFRSMSKAFCVEWLTANSSDQE